MRLSGLSRFFAKNLLGAGIFKEASWEEAMSDMERAVALDPGRLYHRLELAEIYADRKRYDDARSSSPSWRRCPTARSWTASTGARRRSWRPRSPNKK